MNLPVRTASLTAFTIAIAGALSACGGGSDSKTTTAVPSGTASAAVSPTSSLGIRTIDLSTVADVKALEASTGGSFVQTSAIYADLTGDGVDEAVAPISSGGTAGDIAFIVLTPEGAGTKTLLQVAPTDGQGGLSVGVAGSQLVMTRPVYGPEDPNCCPSSLRKTTYAWDGSKFTEESVTTESNSGGGAKRTVVPPSGAPQ